MIEQETQETYAKKLELVQAMAQLDSKEKEIKSAKGYSKAYFWSVVIPPIGIYYFVKYLFFTGGEKEDVKAGVVSLALTLASLFLSFLLIAALFKQPTSSQGLKMLKDLTVPDNQKEILQLYK